MRPIRLASHLTLFALCVLHASPSAAWRTHVNGEATPGNDRVRDVVIDTGGNVVAVGYSTNNLGTHQDFAVVKVSATDGAVLWRYEIPGTVNDNSDSAYAVAVDAVGDVVVAGETPRTQILRGFTVVKLAGGDGKEVWSRMLTEPSEGIGIARATAIDSAGDVLVGGELDGHPAVVKLDGTNGNELWRWVESSSDGGVSSVVVDTAGDAVVGGTLPVLKLSREKGTVVWQSSLSALSLALDGNGDVVGTGANSVIKLAGATGREVWKRDDTGRALAVDLAGDVVTVGSFGVAKFASGKGDELWRSEQCEPGMLMAGLDVAIDTSGNVYSAGVVLDVDTLHFLVGSFHGPDGTSRWCHSVVGGVTDGDDQAEAVAIGPDGDPVGVGAITNIGSDGDMMIAKLAAADGTERWRQIVKGRGFAGEDAAQAVTVDASSDVLAAGQTENNDSGTDFTVVMLRGETGDEVWRWRTAGSQPGGTDVALAVAASASGDVLAGGWISNADTGLDGVVVKLSRTDGHEVWRTAMNGAASGSDRIGTLAIDSMEEVIGGGRISNIEGSTDALVVKLSGADGTERWRTELRGTDSGTNAISRVAVDDHGDVVAVGLIANRSRSFDVLVVKLAGQDGRVLWRREIEGTVAGRSDQGASVAIDANGDVLAGGFVNGIPISGTSATGGDFFVVKLDGISGEDLWNVVVDGGPTNAPPATDGVTAIAVDSDNNAIAAGALEVEGAGQLTVMKLARSDGAELWRRVTGGTGDDFSEAVVVDAEGDIFTAGATSTATGRDMTIVKLAREDGAELWRRDINGTAMDGPTDGALALAVDSAGDAVAAGFTVNENTGADMTVVKLRGSDGRFPAEPTATPTPPPSCVGDCDGSGAVVISELVTGVRIALETLPLARCLSFDGGTDGTVGVDDLVDAVRNALEGCATR